MGKERIWRVFPIPTSVPASVQLLPGNSLRRKTWVSYTQFPDTDLKIMFLFHLNPQTNAHNFVKYCEMYTKTRLAMTLEILTDFFIFLMSFFKWGFWLFYSYLLLGFNDVLSKLYETLHFQISDFCDIFRAADIILAWLTQFTSWLWDSNIPQFPFREGGNNK